MSVDVQLIEGPLPLAVCRRPDGAGAVVRFEGVVRPLEDERLLAALLYEAYEPMTTRELTHLAAAILGEYKLLSIEVQHSLGRVPVGQCSFRLDICSPHRKAGLQAADAFIDRMKRDIPLWKVPEFTLENQQVATVLDRPAGRVGVQKEQAS